MIKAIASILLTVILTACMKQRVPSLITGDVTNITQTSAVCGGEVIDEGSDPVIARGVCWSEIGNPTIEDELTRDGSGPGQYISTLGGLRSETSYYVRAYATNSIGTSYGEIIKFNTNSINMQIIADHRAVEAFDDIPEYWINEVKKMHIYFPGASHSDAYRSGLRFLEDSNSVYRVNVATAQAYTDQYLRSNQNPSGYVQEDVWLTWWDYPEGEKPEAARWITDLLQSYHDGGYPLDVIGFGWCWDMASGFPSPLPDPVYGCRWYGTSTGGIDGNMGWGLDDDDYSVTNNRVSLKDYLDITDYFQDYCDAHGIGTRVIYTTAPVGILSEPQGGYGTRLKSNAIKDWVNADERRILFDYLDILAYDYDGEESTASWEGHTYQYISAINEGDGDVGHISVTGAVRLAKAQWWLLARLAGWDGN